MAGNKPGAALIVVEPDSYMEVMAINYVMKTGFYKLRLAAFLEIDYNTLNRILKDQPEFSNKLKKAEAIYIGNLVTNANMKNPMDILKTKYRAEFPDVKQHEVKIDVSKEFQETMKLIHGEAEDEQIPSYSSEIF